MPLVTRLGSRTILTVGLSLFALNMIVPDPLPLIDEFLILAGTVLLSRLASSSSLSGAGEPSAGDPRTRREASPAPKHVGRGSTH